MSHFKILMAILLIQFMTIFFLVNCIVVSYYVRTAVDKPMVIELKPIKRNLD